jgi:hypothetical protein
MCRSINDTLSLREEIAARCSAGTGAYQRVLSPINVDREHSVASIPAFRRLIDELRSVGRKICLRILAAKGDLLDILQMRFFFDLRKNTRRKEYEKKKAFHRKYPLLKLRDNMKLRNYFHHG